RGREQADDRAAREEGAEERPAERRRHRARRSQPHGDLATVQQKEPARDDGQGGGRDRSEPIHLFARPETASRGAIGGEGVASGGSGERRAAAGRAGAAKRGTAGALARQRG